LQEKFSVEVGLMKKLVFDSSSLISISEKCFMNILGELAENENVEFLIPESVYFESVSRPLKIKKFELNAIRIKEAVDRGWLRVAREDRKLGKLISELSEIANETAYSSRGKIILVDKGELESLALVKRTHADALVIDERTTRMLVEEPQQLKKILEKRLFEKVRLNKHSLQLFKNFVGKTRIIRSVELMALAFEKNYFQKEFSRTRDALEAALYAMKFAGCAVSDHEIEQYLKGALR